ncbi:hypothetical protein VOLCADRAFT_90319 [Volvox carteri f. nagariensis]|uniref:Uncharacterized protein n=1 Tax=Volvox carteri f. nagariensis TaxID=3068 RepID=D8TU24_VOLCA|nr:uncharacterized protein VOLCADRAFT_90319 [Volvox carteri f. nagariensis]EFJ48966.1 hypothetical protein VOLCADRAFT_90319 [Volvox carteri f. nagariensis]|eukprot:XP_002949863.1 hypothetical protein VOLCADRAFT_90319 [Volvox carteri f. nagariensis]
MQPEDVRMLAAHFAWPNASLPDRMMVAAIAVMFAGFLGNPRTSGPKRTRRAKGRPVKATQQGHQLQQRTGSVQSPICSLSYTSFREKLAAMCSTVGIKDGIMPHPMRIKGAAQQRSDWRLKRPTVAGRRTHEHAASGKQSAPELNTFQIKETQLSLFCFLPFFQTH